MSTIVIYLAAALENCIEFVAATKQKIVDVIRSYVAVGPQDLHVQDATGATFSTVIFPSAASVAADWTYCAATQTFTAAATTNSTDRPRKLMWLEMRLGTHHDMSDWIQTVRISSRDRDRIPSPRALVAVWILQGYADLTYPIRLTDTIHVRTLLDDDVTTYTLY